MGDLTKELDRTHEVREKIRGFIRHFREGPFQDVDITTGDLDGKKFIRWLEATKKFLQELQGQYDAVAALKENHAD